MTELDDFLFNAFVWVVVLGWFVLSVVRYDKRHRKPLEKQGTLSSEGSAFDEEPGWLYCQKLVRTDNGSYLVEHFVISVRITRSIRGALSLALPPGMSLPKLESFSPELLDRLCRGYFKEKVALSGLAFDRKTQLALLGALTPLPNLSGCYRIEAKNGRLVLFMERLHQPETSPIHPAVEVVLERTQKALDALSEELTSLAGSQGPLALARKKSRLIAGSGEQGSSAT